MAMLLTAEAGAGATVLWENEVGGAGAGAIALQENVAGVNGGAGATKL